MEELIADLQWLVKKYENGTQPQMCVAAIASAMSGALRIGAHRELQQIVTAWSRQKIKQLTGQDAP